MAQRRLRRMRGPGWRAQSSSHVRHVELRDDAMGLGEDVPISTGNENDALLAIVNGKWFVIRVP